MANLPSDENDSSGHAVAGTAAHPNIKEFRANSGELSDRSLDVLLAWAENNGVSLPHFAKVIPLDEADDFVLTRNGKPVQAKYFEAKGVYADEIIYWQSSEAHRSVVSPSHGLVIINIAADVMKNDERFLHVVAHEVHELTALKQVFDNEHGSITASRFFELTEPLPTAKNLHWYAWDYADALILRLRGGKE